MIDGKYKNLGSFHDEEAACEYDDERPLNKPVNFLSTRARSRR